MTQQASEDLPVMTLRTDCVEGIRVLMKNFQVVLYSIYSDNLTFEIIDYFKEHSIVFDGVYCPL